MPRRKAQADNEAQKPQKNWLKNVKVYKKGEPIPPNVWRVKSVPEQRLRDKIAHDKGLSIASCYTDFERKKFVFSTVRNIDFIPVEVSFEEAAEMYGWKSFKFVMNNQTVVPTWLED